MYPPRGKTCAYMWIIVMELPLLSWKNYKYVIKTGIDLAGLYAADQFLFVYTMNQITRFETAVSNLAGFCYTV